MNSPAVTHFTPSTQPALELIALARLSPELARQKLRALLLANPNYFGKIPSTTFNTVLNIQEDTTYECVSRISYDHLFKEVRATIDIRQPFGYSRDVLIDGSEEFVRFYLSYDGGLKWLDRGVRSIDVFDARLPRPLAYDVTLKITAWEEFFSSKIPPRVRAILSWNSPPPPDAPNWIPVWGNVLESDIQINDSRAVLPSTLHSDSKVESPDTAFRVTKQEVPLEFTLTMRDGHVSVRRLHSSKSDPHHRFLAYVLAQAASYCPTEFQDPRTNRSDLIHQTVSVQAMLTAIPTEPELTAVS